MPAKLIERVVTDLRTWSLPPDGTASDTALVDAFLARRDETAFATLVQRHGPMVFGVCRRILGHAHDAEDAFQAVFWVLARKAPSIRPRAWVGNWLYGVAVRTALKARDLRRRRRETQVDAMPQQTLAPNEPLGEEQGILDEEIERLPAKYRLAVVLCELEGHGRKEVALQLGVPEGTLSSRLANARRILARRLKARGVTLGGGLATLFADSASRAAVPHVLLARAVQAASGAGGASATVLILAKGMMGAMLMNKLKQTAIVAILCLAALGLGVGGRQLLAGADPADDAQTANAGQVEAAQGQPKKARPPADTPSKKTTAPTKPEPTKPADPGAQHGLLGLWRVLQIDGQVNSPPGLSGGPMGIPAGAGGVAIPRGPPFVPEGYNPFESSRTLFYITNDLAVFTSTNSRIEFRLKIGPGVIDMEQVGVFDENANILKGIYELAGNELRLYFGPSKGPRLKNAKGALEIWTLMRQPSRQEIYQKLDQLQGSWKAVSGECNGEAFLPRELETVRLTVSGDRWQMTPPYQPGQPDAVSRQAFNKQTAFVLDSDGPRHVAILQANNGDLRVLYEVRGDELKVCWNAHAYRDGRVNTGSERGIPFPFAPREFKTTPGSELVMFSLARDKTEPSALTPVGPKGSKRSPGALDPFAGDATAPTTSKLKTQVRIAGPEGMKVRLFEAKDDKSVPARFTLDKPGVYRFKLSNIPNRKGKDYYPSLEIVGADSPRIAAFLANAYVSLDLTDEDFAKADEGVLVVRYYSLPDADKNAEERIQASKTRPPTDAKSNVVAILRLGGIDLDAEEPSAGTKR